MKPRRRTRVARTDRFSKHTPSIEVEVVRISGRGEGVGEALGELEGALVSQISREISYDSSGSHGIPATPYTL